MAPTRSSVRLAARRSHVPVSQRAQHKLMRELDFINGQSLVPDAVIIEFVDMFGQDLPEQAVEASEIFAFWSLLKIFFTKIPMPKRLLKIDHFLGVLEHDAKV